MSSTSKETCLTFDDGDGVRVFARRWLPGSERPRAAVQIAHGAAEHSARYRRFAQFLNAAEFAVYADDHRGHGETAGALERAGITGPEGWNGMLRDLHRLSELIRSETEAPLFFLGHSMGSLLAQRFIQLWGGDLSGAVLMGSFGSIANLDDVLAMIEPATLGAEADQPCLPFAGAFASFNEPFGPGGTGYEWLSRDDAEVRKYVDDPWCGFPFSNALVFGMFRGARDAWHADNEARIPKDLPVLVLSGDADPVAGEKAASLRELVARYRALGLRDLECRLYPSGRHEPLNDTNRDEVHRDLLAWFEAHLPKRSR